MTFAAAHMSQRGREEDSGLPPRSDQQLLRDASSLIGPEFTVFATRMKTSLFAAKTREMFVISDRLASTHSHQDSGQIIRKR